MTVTWHIMREALWRDINPNQAMSDLKTFGDAYGFLVVQIVAMVRDAAGAVAS